MGTGTEGAAYTSAVSAAPKSIPAEESRPEAWLVRDHVVAGLIFLLALALRLFHLHEISIHDPFFDLPSVDAAIYDEWARDLLGGKGFGEGVLFLGPLYPLFLAGVYGLFGESLATLKVVQAVLGAITCLLVWGLARDLFGRRVAALSGCATAFYGMHVFYGGTAMIVNLQVPLVVGLVWAAHRALSAPSFGRWAFCGLLLALAALARQTVLLLAPALALWILFGMPGTASFSRRFAWGTAFGLVILALILPFSIRNWVVGEDLVLLNSTGGANFFMGNQHAADGTWQLPAIAWPGRVDNPRSMRDAFQAVAERETGQKLKPSQVSAYWLSRGLAEIRSDPKRWFQLELRKLGLFVNASEVWNNRSIDVSRQFSRALDLPLVGFGLIAPLGLLGLVGTRARWRDLFPIHAAIGAYLLSAMLFFVLSRYRMPATVLLIPFAAQAALDLVARFRAAAWRALALRLLALLTLALLVHLPLVEDNRMHMAWYNLGNKYRTLERWDEAISAYQRSLEAYPRAISTHNNLALSYESAGHREEAISAWARVRTMAIRSRSRRHLERAERHLALLEEPGGVAPEALEPASP
jgi:tetratricopeptide (TPR) repeat protein